VAFAGRYWRGHRRSDRLRNDTSEHAGRGHDCSSVERNGLQGNFSSVELAAQLATVSGQKRVNYEATVSSTSVQYTTMADAELSETGVDVDAQMQELLLIEQTYAANARVIEIASQMINRLMEL
jgi:flagellar hook-associated protein 1 FlgK